MVSPLWDKDSPGDLLLDGLGVGLSEQVEHGAAEVVGVAVGVAQLIGDSVQEQVTSWEDETEGMSQQNSRRLTLQ